MLGQKAVTCRAQVIFSYITPNSQFMLTCIEIKGTINDHAASDVTVGQSQLCEMLAESWSACLGWSDLRP